MIKIPDAEKMVRAGPERYPQVDSHLTDRSLKERVMLLMDAGVVVSNY